MESTLCAHFEKAQVTEDQAAKELEAYTLEWKEVLTDAEHDDFNDKIEEHDALSNELARCKESKREWFELVKSQVESKQMQGPASFAEAAKNGISFNTGVSTGTLDATGACIPDVELAKEVHDRCLSQLKTYDLYLGGNGQAINDLKFKTLIFRDVESHLAFEALTGGGDKGLQKCTMLLAHMCMATKAALKVEEFIDNKYRSTDFGADTIGKIYVRNNSEAALLKKAVPDAMVASIPWDRSIAGMHALSQLSDSGNKARWAEAAKEFKASKKKGGRHQERKKRKKGKKDP